MKTTSVLAFVGWHAIAIALCRCVSSGRAVRSEEQLALVHVCLPSTPPNSWSLVVTVRKEGLADDDMVTLLLSHSILYL